MSLISLFGWIRLGGFAAKYRAAIPACEVVSIVTEKQDEINYFFQICRILIFNCKILNLNCKSHCTLQGGLTAEEIVRL